MLFTHTPQVLSECEAQGQMLSTTQGARDPEIDNPMACYSVYYHGDCPVPPNYFLWHDKDFVRSQGRNNSLKSSNDL